MHTTGKNHCQRTNFLLTRHLKVSEFEKDTQLEVNNACVQCVCVCVCVCACTRVYSRVHVVILSSCVALPG